MEERKQSPQTATEENLLMAMELDERQHVLLNLYLRVFLRDLLASK
jgi:hypothetical protein